MRRLFQISVAAILMLVPAVVIAVRANAESPATSALPLILQTQAAPQPCWLDHVQVQPSPAAFRIRSDFDVGSPRAWSQPGGRPGAEHIDVAKARRACRQQWTTKVGASELIPIFPAERW